MRIRRPVDAPRAEAAELSRAEVRRRASAGVFFLTSTGFLNLLIGFGSSLVLARLLTPTDFGLVAIGMSVTLLGNAVADGGLGSGMVRRAQPPTSRELKALTGIQLTISLVIVVVTVAVAQQFGHAGAVTALMVLALPVTTLQTSGRVALARKMQFDRQAMVDFGAQTVAQTFAVVAVIAGAGVWGLAGGILLRAVVTTCLLGALAARIPLPSLRGWRELRELMLFGVSFQANWIIVVIKEQVLNVVVAAIAGVQTLGYWSLARRVLEVPLLLLGALWNVSYPAMANLLARGEDAGPVIVRTVRRTAVAGTLFFVPFAVASADLVPLLFGEKWRPAATVMPLVLLSLLLQGSISVGTIGFLFALGRPGIVARVSAALGVVTIAVSAALLPSIGIRAIGVGSICGGAVEALLLSRAARSTANVWPLDALVGPLAVAVVTGGAGILVASLLSGGVAVGIAVAGASALAAFAGLWLVCRADLFETIRTAAGTVRDASGPPVVPAEL